MAEIEEAEHRDLGRAREWMSRAMRAAPDPAWTADGVVAEHWMPVSPVSGRLDAFEWRVPLAEIGIERPAFEPEPLLPAVAPPAIKPVPASPDNDKTGRRPRLTGKAPAKASGRGARPAVAEAVIPLVHAPDDPGPDSTLEPDPVPEPSTPPPPDPWQRILQLFR